MEKLRYKDLWPKPQDFVARETTILKKPSTLHEDSGFINKKAHRIQIKGSKSFHRVRRL